MRASARTCLVFRWDSLKIASSKRPEHLQRDEIMVPANLTTRERLPRPRQLYKVSKSLRIRQVSNVQVPRSLALIRSYKNSKLREYKLLQTSTRIYNSRRRKLYAPENFKRNFDRLCTRVISQDTKFKRENQEKLNLKILKCFFYL